MLGNNRAYSMSNKIITARKSVRGGVVQEIVKKYRVTPGTYRQLPFNDDFYTLAGHIATLERITLKNEQSPLFSQSRALQSIDQFVQQYNSSRLRPTSFKIHTEKELNQLKICLLKVGKPVPEGYQYGLVVDIRLNKAFFFYLNDSRDQAGFSTAQQLTKPSSNPHHQAPKRKKNLFDSDSQPSQDDQQTNHHPKAKHTTLPREPKAIFDKPTSRKSYRRHCLRCRRVIYSFQCNYCPDCNYGRTFADMRFKQATYNHSFYSPARVSPQRRPVRVSISPHRQRLFSIEQQRIRFF